MNTGTAARVLEGIVEDLDAVTAEWRENGLFCSVVANELDQYRTYLRPRLDGLRDALRTKGIDLLGKRLRELNVVYHALDPFADVTRAFDLLVDAGYRPSIRSNGTPEMLESLIETAGIAATVSELTSAHDIRKLKPAIELYEHAAARVETPPDRILQATAHWMGAQRTMNAGMQGVYSEPRGRSVAVVRSPTDAHDRLAGYAP